MFSDSDRIAACLGYDVGLRVLNLNVQRLDRWHVCLSCVWAAIASQVRVCWQLMEMPKYDPIAGVCVLVGFAAFGFKC